MHSFLETAMKRNLWSFGQNEIRQITENEMYLNFGYNEISPISENEMYPNFGNFASAISESR